MKYAVLIHEDEARWDGAGEDLVQLYHERHAQFAKEAADRGVAVLAGEALRPVATATTQRQRDGAVTITDGPFAETAEQLGGFYLVDAPNLDAVLEAIRVLPEPTIEIRPVAVFD
jgi:hypothetical protein